jgi:Animal haem peroxidase
MKRRFTLPALAASIGILLATPAITAATPSQDPIQTRASSFGRMFPDLPPLNSQTPQQLADLAQTQLDPNADSENNQDPEMTSIYTYFGQFVDHDLTLDTSPSPTTTVDPTTLKNGRTFKFDLDSVYGGGPSVSPQLYEADGQHFRVQNPNPNGVIDLPRNPDGSAILVEQRNDENEIISQIHTAFLLLHNSFIDQGMSFADAQRRTILLYQTIVLRELLPHFTGQAAIDAARTDRSLYKPGNPQAPMTPVEFSVAAYRFGHSMVRRAYELTNTTGKIQVFSLTAPDLRGGRNLPAGRQIDWGNFVHELSRPDNLTPVSHVNQSRKIDTLISSSLFVLPIPGAEASGSNVLAFRNLVRAKFYDMPSGQDVAKAMGLPVITPAELNLGPAFDNGTPLWYYILAESSRTQDGKQLGPVGARIVASVFVRLLQIDKDSILRGNRDFTPKTFEFDQLFIAAGLAKAA